jgi:hypothetical protein
MPQLILALLDHAQLGFPDVWAHDREISKKVFDSRLSLPENL